MHQNNNNNEMDKNQIKIWRRSTNIMVMSRILNKYHIQILITWSALKLLVLTITKSQYYPIIKADGLNNAPI